MQSSRPGRALTVLAAVVLAIVVGACGSSSSSGTSKSKASPTTSAKSGPGSGKPPITLGDKNFSEEFVLGALYQQALAAKGFKVTLKKDIGSTEVIYKDLKNGTIEMYPEYTGTLLSTAAGVSKPIPTAQDTYTQAQAFVKKDGFMLLQQTPFYDADALGVTKAFAAKHSLKTIEDLKKLGKFKFGGPAENRTRYLGLVGLQKIYGLNPTFVPLGEGLAYKALDSGQVDVNTAFTTDPQLQTGKYVVLTDSKKLFGFQNVAPIVKKSLLSSEGPAFVQTIDKVSSLLTLKAVARLNAAVSLEQQSPDSVAHQFLAANGLA